MAVTIFPSLLPDDVDGEGIQDDRGDDQGGADVATALEDGRCPWCEEYDGESPKQHAAQAHAEEWAEWRED